MFLDTTNDGLQNRTAWAGAGDAVLFYDPDNLDAITESRQFIFTEWDPTADSDLDAVRNVFDSNGDGKLTAADDAFADFKLMVTHADGSTSVITLAEAGIVEIDLNPDATLITLPDGSQITGQTSFTYADGTTGIVAGTTLNTDLNSYKIVQLSSTAADGSHTIETKGHNTAGDLAFTILSVTSADGSSIRNEYDDDGNGAVDRIQTIETVTDASGSVIETATNWTGASESTGVLADQEIKTTSADGNTLTIERDLTGGGWFSEVETRTTLTDGSQSIEVKSLARDGSVLGSTTDALSTDGKTRDRAIDLDGDGDDDVLTVKAIVDLANGDRQETVTVSNGDGSLRTSSSELVSNGGSNQVVSEDLDGDGQGDVTTTSSTVVNADDTTTSTSVVTNQDGSVRSSTTTVQSEDARSKSTAIDHDGDGTADLKTDDFTTIVNDVRTKTVKIASADDTISSHVKSVLQADGISQEDWIDLNQDGTFQASDLVREVTVNGTTNERIATSYDRNADGSINSTTQSTTSADGNTVSTNVDADGDGDSDTSVSDVTVVDANGVSVQTIETRNNDGSLRSSSVTTTSADGLSSVLASDIDGDGDVDRFVKSETVANDDGSVTITASEYAGDDTTLLSRTVTTQSADRLTREVSIDENGDGNVDRIEHSRQMDDGSTTVTTTAYNPNGDIISKTVSNISANGLEVITTSDNNGDAIDEQTVSETTEYLSDGSSSKTTLINNGDGSLRSKIIETVSDDGLTVTTETDADGDGDGQFEQTLTSETILNADGSRTTSELLKSTDGVTISETQVTVSDDGLETVIRQDLDADGVFELITTETTLLQADGSTVVERELRDHAGVLRNKTVTTKSANGRFESTSEDVNGDGLVDAIVTAAVADDGVTTVVTEQLDTADNVQSRQVETTSANGLSQTIEIDMDGDGIFEKTQHINTVLNSDGSSTVTDTLKSEDSSVISQMVSEASADDLSSEQTEDIDGDGTIDFSAETQTTLSADGSQSTSVSAYSRDGSLTRSTTEDTSADQRSKIIREDLDGNGAVDLEVATQVLDNGSVVEKTTHYSTTGVIHSLSESSISADGLTQRSRIDANADGEAELVVEDNTVYKDDGSIVRSVNYLNDRFIDLGSAIYLTSDDGLFSSSVLDLDGDGTTDFRSEDQTTLNADGSTDQVQTTFDGSSNRLAKITTSTSGNGLEISIRADVDEDQADDRWFTRSESADGGYVEEFKYLSSGYQVLRVSSVQQSADGRTMVSKLDDNGDDVWDYETTTQIDLDGNTRQTWKTLDVLGTVESLIERETSANGYSEITKFYTSSDGQHINDVDFVWRSSSSYSSDGSKVDITLYEDAAGNLIESRKTTVSADGLLRQVEIDSDGDGVVDITAQTTVIIEDDGSRTTVLQSHYADGTLKEYSKTTESSDGRHYEAVYDYDGDGINELQLSRHSSSDGETTTIRTTYNEAGHVTDNRTTTVSADGLETVVLRETGVQITSLLPGETGSYDFVSKDTPTAAATFEATHRIDAFGIDTWRVNKASGFTKTVRIDQQAKDAAFAEAQALFDTIYDRDMNQLEREQLAEYLEDGLLNRTNLLDALLGSNEFATRYGTLTDTQFVHQLYLNSFGRSATLSELDQFLEELDTTAISRSELAADIAFSNEHAVVGNGHRMTNNYNANLSDIAAEFSTDRSFVETQIRSVIAIAYGREAHAQEIDVFIDRIQNNSEKIFAVTNELIGLTRI